MRNYSLVYMQIHAVSIFGAKVMYLERSGWKSMPLTEAVFDMKNWLLPRG